MVPFTSPVARGMRQADRDGLREPAGLPRFEYASRFPFGDDYTRLRLGLSSRIQHISQIFIAIV